VTRVRHASAVENDDLVGVADRAQAVRDDETRAATAAEVSSRAFSVAGSSALVASSRMRTDGFETSGAGDLEALSLAAAEVSAALFDPGLVAALRPTISSMDASILRGADHLRLRDRHIPKGEIFDHSTFE